MLLKLDKQTFCICCSSKGFQIHFNFFSLFSSVTDWLPIHWKCIDALWVTFKGEGCTQISIWFLGILLDTVAFQKPFRDRFSMQKAWLLKYFFFSLLFPILPFPCQWNATNLFSFPRPTIFPIRFECLIRPVNPLETSRKNAMRFQVHSSYFHI